jgi:riboflavin kinase/FMN adenylyltransferase
MAEKTSRAVALGLFDGVHRGHREVISFPVKLEEKGMIPSVFTFSSDTVGEKQGRRIEYIYTDSQKEIILKSLGIRDVFSENFNALKDLSGEEFVTEILIGKIHADYVVCGHDFRFGKSASCGIDELAEYGRKFGFGVEVVRDVSLNGENISSNKIRSLLKDGEIAAANILLGADYRIDGEVVHGRQIGRTIDFPTVNQLFGENQLVPRKGVYRSVTAADGKVYNSITNIGVKPTVGDDIKPSAETHIIGYSGNLYGKNITVTLSEFVRDERKFNSVDELRTQIQNDINFVKTEKD